LALRGEFDVSGGWYDAGDYLCNFTLYRLLKHAPGISAAFLHIPQAVELADGGAMSLEVLERAVKAAAQAYARALRPQRAPL